MNESAIYTLLAIVSDMTNVYPKLREVIKESESYDNPQRYVAFRWGSIRGTWFGKNYLPERKTSNLKGAIQTLSASYLKGSQSAQAAKALELNMYRSTTQDKGLTGSKHFVELEFYLPELLLELAAKCPKHSSSLTMMSKRLLNEVAKTQQLYDAAFNEVAKPKAEKSDVLGKQNASVEAIINDVLATLDSKVAHNIRTLLARADNKLLVLQAELAKI